MPKTLEEFIQDVGKPKNIKEHVVYGWNWAKTKIQTGADWVVNHPQEAAIYTTLTAGAAKVLKKGCKTVDKYVTARRETYNKERYVYDHSAGRYLKTRKVLRSNDVRRINDLRARHPGMKMSEALERLNLLD